jgi:hypothetical protein
MSMAAHSAPPRRFDLRDLRRLALWGTAAAGALMLAVYAGTTDTGKDRLMLALAKINVVDLTRFVARAAPPRPEISDAHKLAAQVQSLESDRDRLADRLATLERSVSDITGSIRSAGADTKPAPMPQLATTALSSELATASASQSPAAPIDQNAARTEFGIDLGGGTNVDALRALWIAAKARHAGLLDNLRPIIAIRENTRPSGVELRLVAGPIGSAATAAKLCTSIVATGAICQPAVYDGQRLAGP